MNVFDGTISSYGKNFSTPSLPKSRPAGQLQNYAMNFGFLGGLAPFPRGASCVANYVISYQILFPKLRLFEP
jgi:hypothetical protein